MDATGHSALDAAARNEIADRGFDAPWQARAVALAVETVDRLGLTWDDFRTRLMEQVAARPDDDYYAAWVAALELLVADLGVADRDDLARRRIEAAGYVTELASRTTAVVALSPSPPVVEAVVDEVAATGVVVSLDPQRCRHLEVHAHDGVHRLVAYGADGSAVLDVELPDDVAGAVVERYAGATTWPAPTIESRDTSAASSSASRSSVPDGRSGSTK
jgi:nitrile hydratase accessory protein